MATYHYRIKKAGSDKPEDGEIEADSTLDANKKLRAQGAIVLQVGEQIGGPKDKFSFKRKKVSLKEKIIFTRQLAVMIQAGLPIVKAMEALGRQSENQYFKTVISGMIVHVKGGAPLSKTLARYPNIFSEVYIAVVKAGEESGQMADVLKHLADQQEKDAEIIGKVKGALIYPGVILVALIAVVGIVVFFVIPSLQKVFTDMGGELPFMTRLLFGVSTFFLQYYWLLPLIVIVVVFGLRTIIRQPQGRYAYDRFKLKLPIFGGLTKKLYMARFARTLAMLVRATLPILASLKIVQQTINNKHYDAAFRQIIHDVESGRALSKALVKQPLFPAMVPQLISLGEESGNLETVLLEIAKFYDSEVETVTKNLATLIEPVMLIVMGLGVGFIVAAVLGPIYNLVGQIS